MRSLFFAVALVACTGGDNPFSHHPQCSDGKDNDNDGMIDFPDDIGCTSDSDDSEDSPPAPQCKDGRDNDGDGKIDYPNDPGCFAGQQDDETDDCPDGPSCPQCSDGKDNDENGKIDYPNDPGCSSAGDADEYTDNPLACGGGVMIKPLPPDGHAMGMLQNGMPSQMASPMCGGAGTEDVYELRMLHPKIVVASTDNTITNANTVLYIRGSDCMNVASELTCSDDMSTTNTTSTVTKSITMPGTYYLVVDSHDSTSGGTYDLQVNYYKGEGEMCALDSDCFTGYVCRVPMGGTGKVCAPHVCSDGVDDDGDGKADFPFDPGCTSMDDDDESDPCPGAGCPACSDNVDNDGDTKKDYPADFGCASAAGTTEVFCMPEADAPVLVTTSPMTGTTVGKANNFTPSCSTGSTAPEITYALNLPVAVQTLVIDTIGSSFDTVMMLQNTACNMQIQCDDDSGGSLKSQITVTNAAPGGYAITVDGYSTNTGTVTLNVKGTVAAGTPCSSPLFSGGASAVLQCQTGTTCTGSPARCQ